MKKSIFVLAMIFILISPNIIYADTAASNQWCTNVGNSTDPSPCQSGSGHCSSQPSNPNDYKQSIIQDFGITMNGYEPKFLQWAWEKFCEVSGTKFNSYVKGSI